MPRHYGDLGFGKSPATEAHECRHSRHNLPRGQSCMRYEMPKFEVEAPIQEKRKKHKSQVHLCPSCHCLPETRYSVEKEPRQTESIEALLKEYQNYLLEPKNSSIKRSKSPFSLPTGLRCRMAGDIHGSKKTAGQYHSSKNEYSEELHAMLTDMINSGLTDENTEICDKTVHRKEHFKSDGQLPCNPEESEIDSDYTKKYFPDHCQSKKDKARCFERSRESIEKCKKERDEEQQQTKRDCEEINQLTLEVKQFEKMKGITQKDPGRMEKKKIKCRKESNSQNKKPTFIKKPPVSRIDLPTGNNPPTKLGAYPRCKVEASTSYHSLPKTDQDFDNDVQGNFSNCTQLEQDLKENPYSKLSRRSAFVNSQVQKSQENDVEILDLRNKNEFTNKGEETNESRKNLYAGGDLDLHTCKSYVVDLIDRALSKQLETQPGEKKVDVTNNAAIWQEMCIEVTRALQGDYCQSFPQNLYNFQENMDNVKLLKSFRWAYVKHIQEELRSLEKIIDICSPRNIKKKSPSS